MAPGHIKNCRTNVLIEFRKLDKIGRIKKQTVNY